MAKGVVGLDIGTRVVTVAHVQVKSGAPHVVNFGGVELPEGAVREGEIIDTGAVADAVKRIMRETGIKEKACWVGVANQRVVVRQIDLPWLPDQELRQSLRFQVQEYIPIPVEDAELDFHVLEEYQTDTDTRMMRMLLVAAHKDMVASHITAATQGGLRPSGVDLNPFAMLRALVGDGSYSQETEVLVDIGAGVTNIVVHEGGVPRFVRILVLGGDDITQALASGLNISYTDAEATKHQSGLGQQDTAGQIIDERANRFVDEIRSSLDYYQAQTGSTRLSRVRVVGGGALLHGLLERLAGALRLPVELGRPSEQVAIEQSAHTPEQFAYLEPTLTTAIGLGMGGVE